MIREMKTGRYAKRRSNDTGNERWMIRETVRNSLTKTRLQGEDTNETIHDKENFNNTR